MNKKPNVFIIGGGLAGLVNAILLSKAGFEVTLAERKVFPFNKVCGEYVSNEVLPFLKNIGLYPDEMGASKIEKLIISSPNGKKINANLDLGGFGISRYNLDNELYKIAVSQGVNFLLGEKVNDVSYTDNRFKIEIHNKTLITDIVIAAYGKRSNLDQKLNRSFFYKRSPYLGVKYHIKSDFLKDTIQLDNFEGGYCGINKIEKDLYCLCYLAENKYLKKHGSIKSLEEEVLMKNPELKEIFNHAEFVWEKPETINEISFEQKSLVDNHILMCGDTAGMVAPLCGNGMAMAIHSAKILSETIIQFCQNGMDPLIRNKIEAQYTQNWNRQFKWRLKNGRAIQRVFGNSWVSNTAIGLIGGFPDVLNCMIKKTHGSPF